ncbi:asparagine synthase-related protein [Aerosakkonemataceae cyanobacterium BLCC-F154]|uniref:asparagine synthase (glutamine-hydrolyzing) n=1 Tax=Floridaenema fluviatile BLCC-F154 TaxID=3153640 RepID=A0ABV4YB68_9CYAN
MSGIVGIINRNETAIDRDLLQQMTEFMSDRGPDAQEIWLDGNVGFGHTMLQTTRESLEEKQPFSLDGKVWITADARVDGRSELIEKLRIKDNITDVELILRAYLVWGEDCVQYLLGDFAFGIWDEREQKLFCARDHFGVKPFYYAEVGQSLIFSNTLNCLRVHPGVSDELNDLAIADFLLFGYNQELATTSFADIQRLPPAHYLIWSRERLQIKRYWTLPTDGYIRYKRASDYVEHFRELMERAVSDRLRTNQVGTFMSGGMDSSTVAAVAKEVLLKQSQSFDFRAYTVVYDRLIPDRERYYSGLVAEKLDIPINYLIADNYKLFERWEQPELHLPEPSLAPLLALSRDQFRQVATQSRIVLDGNGGDPVLYGSSSYFFMLLKQLQLVELVTTVGQYFWFHKRFPPIGLRTQLKRKLGMWHPWQPPYPQWLNPEFAKHLDLSSRWEKHYCQKETVHPYRQEAYQTLMLPTWTLLFESCDPGVTLIPVEARYPFFDLRLINYLLAIPPIPWFIHKHLTRVAMQGILPEAVVKRPKTPLAGDPFAVLLKQSNSEWIDRWKITPEMSKYVVRDAVPKIAEKEDYSNEVWLNLRPLSLAHWLQQLKPVKMKSVTEDYYEISSGKLH